MVNQTLIKEYFPLRFLILQGFSEDENYKFFKKLGSLNG